MEQRDGSWKSHGKWKLVVRCFKGQTKNVDFCGRQWGATEGCREMGSKDEAIACRMGDEGQGLEATAVI